MKKRDTFIIIFIFVTLFCFITLGGYYFNYTGEGGFSVSGDHIPLIMMEKHDNLFKGDIIHVARENFATFFFKFVSLLVTEDVKDIEMKYFLLFLLSNFITLFFLAKIFNIFTGDPYISMLTAFSLYTGFSPTLATHFPFPEMSHTVFAVPFIFAAVYCFFKDRFYFMFILLGISALFHVILSVPVAAAAGLYSMARGKKLGLLKIFSGFFIYFVFCAFLFYVKPPSGGKNLPIPEWLDILSKTSADHFFPFRWGLDRSIRFILFAFLGYYCFRKADASTPVRKEQAFKIKVMLAASGIFLFMGIFFVEIIPLPKVIMLSCFRATVYVVVLLYSFIIGDIIKGIRDGDFLAKTACILTLGMFISNYYTNLLSLCIAAFILNDVRLHRKNNRTLLAGITVSLLIIVCFKYAAHFLHYAAHQEMNAILDYKNTEAFRIFKLIPFFMSIFIYFLSVKLFNKKNHAAMLCVCLSATFCVTGVYKLFFLGVSSFYPRPDAYWINTQLWCRKNVAEDAMILVPPYSVGFRNYSLRPVYVNSATYINHNPFYFSVWWSRMKKLGYTRNNLFNADVYDSIDEETIRKLSREFNIQYAVVKNSTSLKFKEVMENAKYKVYKISP